MGGFDLPGISLLLFLRRIRWLGMPCGVLLRCRGDIPSLSLLDDLSSMAGGYFLVDHLWGDGRVFEDDRFCGFGGMVRGRLAGYAQQLVQECHGNGDDALQVDGDGRFLFEHEGFDGAGGLAALGYGVDCDFFEVDQGCFILLLVGVGVCWG